MLVICFMHVFTIASSMGIRVPSEGHNSLLNKHLKVAASPWKPFIIFYCNGKEINDKDDDCPDKGNQTYGGALWELLKLVKHARNVTYSILRPPRSEPGWGTCNANDNCTGMIGMVNRNEVDFALGNMSIWHGN